MSKNILIIQGNPVAPSFSGLLADAYREGALLSGAEVKTLTLSSMDFNPVLRGGYRERTPLEPDLNEAREAILHADHLVWIYPLWWGSTPALLKGFIDRVFLPGYAFKYQKGSPLPEQLLKGRSARAIVTMDAPVWYYRWIQQQPGHRLLKYSLLHFCGVKPVKITSIGRLNKLGEQERQQWLQKIKKMGTKLA